MIFSPIIYRGFMKKRDVMIPIRFRVNETIYKQLRTFCLMPDDEHAFFNLALKEFMDNHKNELEALNRRVKND